MQGFHILVRRAHFVWLSHNFPRYLTDGCGALPFISTDHGVAKEGILFLAISLSHDKVNLCLEESRGEERKFGEGIFILLLIWMRMKKKGKYIIAERLAVEKNKIMFIIKFRKYKNIILLFFFHFLSELERNIWFVSLRGDYEEIFSIHFPFPSPLSCFSSFHFPPSSSVATVYVYELG